MSAAPKAAYGIVLTLLLAACGKGANYSQVPPIIGPVGGNTQGPDAGDGGVSDAGDGGLPDGGRADGGCVAAVGVRAVTSAIDGCAGQTTLGTASLVVSTGNCQAALQTSASFCSGTVSTSSNAFQGACGLYQSCTSTSLPGIVNCALNAQPNAQTCTITVCGGLNGGCGP